MGRSSLPLCVMCPRHVRLRNFDGSSRYESAVSSGGQADSTRPGGKGPNCLHPLDDPCAIRPSERDWNTTDEDSPSPRPSPSMRPLRYPFPLDGEGRDGGEKGFTARFHSLPASPWIPAFAGMTELFKGLLDGEGVSMPSPRFCLGLLRRVQHDGAGVSMP